MQKSRVISSKFISITLIAAISYFLIFILINNTNLIYTTLVSAFPLRVKAEIIISLITGVGESMDSVSLSLLLIIALLTGLNVSLLFKKVAIMRLYGKLKFVVGGSSILGLFSSGCASCSLPIFAFFGIGSSAGSLPLRGYEFSLITISLLSYSSYILIKQIKKKPACAIIVSKKDIKQNTHNSP